MKHLKTFFLFLSILTFFSCKKDGGTTKTYPRNVTVTYKMTSTSGGITAVTSGSYTNNTEGTTSFDNAALPYTTTFARTVNRYDDLSITFLHDNSATNTPFTIKLEILVDNVVVKTQSYSGTSSAIGSTVYLFP